MKIKHASIFTIVLVLLSGIPLVSGAGMNYVNAKYAPANTQSQGNANDCDAGTNCAINSPQIQGDGSASSPTNLQISKFNDEEQADGVGGGLDCPPFTFPECAFIIVTKHVICPEGFVCPSAIGHLMIVSDRNGGSTPREDYSPRLFLGSETGTTVQITFNDQELPIGAYSIIEIPLAPPPAGLILHTTPEGECGSPSTYVLISPGETKRCTLINEYRVAPTP